MSDRRSSVAINRMLGNAAKSSGLDEYTEASSTIIARAMLKVNSRSSMKAGRGKIIMTRMRNSSTGVPRPVSMDKRSAPAPETAPTTSFVAIAPVLCI